ncbi:peptide-binding protein [Yinghuangia aomiensis]|uniref:Peptide-binding protein n=2 Tax=Yinghuangia aomiensis TaxID=676205 RepID=A0ABP9I434_9ACTN
MAALYDPLMYIDPTDGKVKPHLAQNLATSDGGATWTLKLRSGVRFSDGTPFDAAAVKMNYDLHAKRETQSIHVQYALGLQTTVQDPQTLLIRPPKANPNFDRLVATHLTYIEAPSALGKGLDVAGARPIGAGPFRLESWTRGSQQVFVKNENYWQKDKGLPKLEKVTMKTVPDPQQQFTTVKAGGADMFYSSAPDLLAKGRSELQADEQKSLGGQTIQFNMNRPPFDDPRARRAIALAIDPADIPKTLGNGFVPAASYFNASSPFFDPAQTQPAPDKAEAQKIFDELAAEGKRVDFTFLVPKATSQVPEYLQSRLNTFRNVSVKVDSLEIGAYVVKYAIQRDYQAILTQGWSVDPEPELYQAFASSSVSNLIGWKSPAADAALDAGRNSTDPAVRKQAYSDLQKALVTELPLFAYAESSIGPIFGKQVTGVVRYNSGTVFMDRLEVN